MEKKNILTKLNNDKIKFENAEMLKRKEITFYFEQETQNLKSLQEKRELRLNENIKRKI